MLINLVILWYLTNLFYRDKIVKILIKGATMVNKFFIIDENFKNIIDKSLRENMGVTSILSIKPIYTGWTNIVYRVEANNGNYYLRFPRDEFWSRTIVKDYQFARFINGKTSFNTVDLKLAYDNGRPFSIHKEFEGASLAERIRAMSNDEVESVSKQLAKFMFELHNVKFNKADIFSVDNIGLELNDFITELLDKHVSTDDKAFWKFDNFEFSGEKCLVHGDLNLSNVILDNDNNIAAVIDFGFAGFGNKYFDLARVLSRNYPPVFRDCIIHSYEEIEGSSLDISELDKNVNTWKNIDSGYMNYMIKMGIYEKE